MRKTNRILAAVLAAGLLLTPSALAAERATRGEVARMVLAAADDYNPGVKLEDILQGNDSGICVRMQRPPGRKRLLCSSGHLEIFRHRWGTMRAI